VANAKGGVYGRQLRLVAADDGYEPTRTAATIKQLYETDQVFGLVGNVGTPTAVVALPYALDRKIMSSTTEPATPKKPPLW
jgi:ABC-type branched-subunit amino acid transport system substrate-binding protein